MFRYLTKFSLSSNFKLLILTFCMVAFYANTWSQIEEGCHSLEKPNCGYNSINPDAEICYPEVTGFSVKYLGVTEEPGTGSQKLTYSISVSGEGHSQPLRGFSVEVWVIQTYNGNQSAPDNPGGCGKITKGADCVSCSESCVMYYTAAPTGTILDFYAKAVEEVAQSEFCDCTSSKITLVADWSAIPDNDIPVPPTVTELGPPTCESQVGNPINVKNGNKFLERTDVVIGNDFNFPIVFKRVYNSYTDREGVLGGNWSHSFEYGAIGDTYRNEIEFYDANGNTVIFKEVEKEGQIQYIPNFGSNYMIDYNEVDPLLERIYTVTKDDKSKVILKKGLNFPSKGELTLESANGININFEYNVNGDIEKIADSSGKFITLHYGTNDKLQYIKDASLNVLVTYSYNVNGYLEKVDYSDGSFEKYYYESPYGDRYLTKILQSDDNIEDSEDFTWYYNYNTDGMADGNYGPDYTEETYPGSGVYQEINKVEVNYSSICETCPFYVLSTTDHYDKDGNVMGTSNYYSKWNPQYDHRVLYQTDNPYCSECGDYEYDGKGNKELITRKNGEQDIQVFDLRGNLLQKIMAVGSPNEQEVRFEYDPVLDLPTKITYPSVTDQYHIKWDTVKITYTTNGDVDLVEEKVWEDDGLGGVTSVSYTTDYDYYDAGDPEQYKYVGQLKSINGPRTDVTDITTFTYYTNGDVKKVIDAKGNETEYSIRNALGQIEWVIEPNGIKTAFEYDARGRLNKVTENADSPTNKKITEMTYNFKGEILTLTKPDGSIITNTYDKRGWLDYTVNDFLEKIDYSYDINSNVNKVELKKADESVVMTESAAYDYLSKLESITKSNGTDSYDVTYNSSNLVETTTDPNGIVKTIIYDEQNRVYKVQQTVNSVLKETKYEYDTHDNLTIVTDPENKIYNFTYDDRGNLLKEDNPVSGVTTYEYDEASNLTQKTDANGSVITYTYDELNRLLSVTYDTDKSIQYIYDGTEFSYGLGRLYKVQTFNGAIMESETKYEYDFFGRVINEIRNLQILGNTFDDTTKYAYSSDHKSQTITYPSGIEVLYRLDNVGQILKVFWKQPGETWQIIADPISYMPYGGVKQIDFSNNLSTEILYNNDYGVDAIHTGIDVNNPNIIDRSYLYHPEGNVHTITDGLDANNTYTYTYDDYENLETASNPSYPNGNHTFTYQANGNIASKTVGTNPSLIFNYNVNNRLEMITENSIVIDSFVYDAIGNIIICSTATIETGYHYDELGRLISIDSLDNLKQPPMTTPEEIARYTYDAQSRRIAKTNSSQGLRYYTYDLYGNVISEFDSTGKWDVAYIYLYDQPLAMIKEHMDIQIPIAPPDSGLGGHTMGVTGGGTLPPPDPDPDPDPDPPTPLDLDVFFYHNDHLGTPMALTDESGTVRWSTDYYPFGEVYNESYNIANNFRFPGQYYDEESTVYYNWHRYYHPNTGRYLTPDPLGLAGGINLYSYAGNNPINYIDPTGLESKRNWWELLEEGHYYGTTYGEEAVDYWADKYNSADSWYDNLYYWGGGVTASLWTKDNWMWTAGSLAAAGGSQVCGLASQGPWLGTFGLHQPHHGLGKHLELILRFGEKQLKVIFPGKDKLLWWQFK